MANGFMVIDKKAWEEADSEQRAWMTYNTLESINNRLRKIEGKSRFDKAWSFMGGVVGGAVAWLGIKIGG